MNMILTGILCTVIACIFAIVTNFNNHYAKFISFEQQAQKNPAIGFNLSGELEVSDASIENIVIGMYQEFDRAFDNDQDTIWFEDIDHKDLVVRSTVLTGVFAYTLPIQKILYRLENSNCSDLFLRFVSPKGLSIIDPLTKPEDHSNDSTTLMQFSESKLHSVELKHMTIHLFGGMADRQFEVLNVLDEQNSIFLSKSMFHKCGSVYSIVPCDEVNTASSNRALNTFGLKILPGNARDICEIRILNYINMIFPGSRKFQYYINALIFPLYLYYRSILLNIGW
jgi:hypothetical protein